MGKKVKIKQSGDSSLGKDAIVNYILDNEKEVYVVENDTRDGELNRVTLAIKLDYGLEIHSKYPIDDVIDEVNELALQVLERTNGYESVIVAVNKNRTASERHKHLNHVFKHWNPEDYNHDEDNDVFFEGYRLTMRK